MCLIKNIFFVIPLLALSSCGINHGRETIDFNSDWKFQLTDHVSVQDTSFNDASWRTLDLPHDWSIEGSFDEKNPAGVGGGALPGGIGWYRKEFTLTQKDDGKRITIEFDGVYRNSEVWINGHLLGKRPNGYISFQYDLTPYLNFEKPNVLLVKADNSKQPNSRWYSGSGIFRNVRLVKTAKVYVNYNGTVIHTSEIKSDEATVEVVVSITNSLTTDQPVVVTTKIYNTQGEPVGEVKTDASLPPGAIKDIRATVKISTPELWNVESPKRYKAVTQITGEKSIHDEYVTRFGFRNFSFDVDNGFSLNGKPLKIKGVCMHHDLGCLGSAFNHRAAERQLEILKAMGVNAIRTSHNPPDPQLLDLCDSMGFMVMDEMFDMWKRKKTEFDYSNDWDEWHKQDLQDFIKRDRNHPSVILWSIGNEIGEQWDSTGTSLAKELVAIVHSLDTSRPVTTANNEINSNAIIKSGALDLIGYNYNHNRFKDFQKDYPNQKFIATETTSALETRGYYDMPSDSVRIWPVTWDKVFTEGNPDNTVSAYDHVRAPWGSTHEETWKEIKKYNFLSGMFVWTGFDYLGEPTPYVWPSRSSYFGIVDLAGFPKDVYYMYQSEWTDKPVLHLFPHWNWPTGKVVDAWVYYNQADEVELFLNGKSLGIKRKVGDELHVQWRITFEPGVLKAISRKDGKEVLIREVKTAGKPFRIILEPDRNSIHADGKDLSFVTVKVCDKEGIQVPDAESEITFDVQGAGSIAGVDNGNPVSHEAFKSNTRKAFHGLCLVVLRGEPKKGILKLKASSANLERAEIAIAVK